jgi:hypothetical protein
MQSRFDKVLLMTSVDSEVNDCLFMIRRLTGRGIWVGHAAMIIMCDDIDVMRGCLQNLEVALKADYALIQINIVP